MKDEQWFNWGGLIFFSLMNPIFGVIYLLVKNKERNKKWKEI